MNIHKELEVDTHYELGSFTSTDLWGFAMDIEEAALDGWGFVGCSQDSDGGIRVSVAREQQHFRLDGVDQKRAPSAAGRPTGRHRAASTAKSPDLVEGRRAPVEQPRQRRQRQPISLSPDDALTEPE